jgi:Uma2 family endonuclease
MLTKPRVSVEEYLALPEEGPPWLEYIRGEVVEKPVGNANHFQLASRLVALLERFRELHGGRSGVEGRSRFADPDDPRFMLPDISFFKKGMRYREGLMLFPPTLALEVRSPGQSMNYQRQRADYYLSHGVEEAWIIDYDPQRIEVRHADGSVRTAADGVVRSVALAGFEVDFAWLFADIDDEYA